MNMSRRQSDQRFGCPPDFLNRANRGVHKNRESRKFAIQPSDACIVMNRGIAGIAKRLGIHGDARDASVAIPRD
jgi:hypothetical protein